MKRESEKKINVESFVNEKKKETIIEKIESICKVERKEIHEEVKKRKFLREKKRGVRKETGES